MVRFLLALILLNGLSSFAFRVSPLNIPPKRQGTIPARFGRSVGNEIREMCQEP